MTIKNLSTGKPYDVTKENYEKFFKGKENWEIMVEPKNQVIENTAGANEKDLKDKKDKNSKHKTNKNQ